MAFSPLLSPFLPESTYPLFLSPNRDTKVRKSPCKILGLKWSHFIISLNVSKLYSDSLVWHISPIMNFIHSLSKLIFFFFFFFLIFFGLFRSASETCRNSQARHQIELQLPAYATAIATPDPMRVCDLHHSSLTQWARPGIEPASSWILVEVITNVPPKWH